MNPLTDLQWTTLKFPDGPWLFKGELWVKPRFRNAPNQVSTFTAWLLAEPGMVSATLSTGQSVKIISRDTLDEVCATEHFKPFEPRLRDAWHRAVDLEQIMLLRDAARD